MHRRQRKEVPDVEAELSATPRVSVDPMCMYENLERLTPVAIDHESGRVWSYAVKDKTMLDGTGWIQKRIAQDIDNVAHKHVTIMIARDQELSMVALQHEIQRIRDAKTILVNSPVGKSECNGRAENAIRRMQLITRYHMGKGRNTAYERIRGKTGNELVRQVGESVLYMAVNCPKMNEKKSQSSMREAIWLGTNERTEENTICTNKGVAKSRTVQRKPEGARRNTTQLLEMKGSVLQPVPGPNADKAPTGRVDENKCPVKAKAYAPERPRYVPDKLATKLATARKAPKIFRKDVENYDPTPGCRVRTEAITGRDNNRRAITQNLPHNNACRARTAELTTRNRQPSCRKGRGEAGDVPGTHRREQNGNHRRRERERESTAGEIMTDDMAQETDVASHVSSAGKDKSEFHAFLNNIHVSFAQAVEERHEVNEM